MTLEKSVELLLQIKTLKLNPDRYLEEKIRRTAVNLVCISYLFSENLQWDTNFS